jgi:hypothetical protein
MTWLAITGALIALAVGIWLGLGAPGWPHKEAKPGSTRRRLEKRNINPIAWTRRDSSRRNRDRRRR